MANRRRKNTTYVKLKVDSERDTVRTRLLSVIHGTVKDVWFYIALAITIFSASNTFRPQLSVQSISNPEYIISSLFYINNVGYWPVNNAIVSCKIFSGSALIATSMDNIIRRNSDFPAEGNPTIGSIVRGGIATRDCALPPNLVSFGPIRQGAIRIDVRVSYNWAWGWLSGETYQRFDVRNLAGKNVLVPDVE